MLAATPPTPPAGHTACCMRKVRRWARRGLLGKRFGAVFGRVALASVVVGKKYKGVRGTTASYY